MCVRSFMSVKCTINNLISIHYFHSCHRRLICTVVPFTRLDGNLPCQSHVPRTAPHIHAELSAWHNPLAPLPDAQIPSSQLESRRVARSHRKTDLVESTKLFWWLASACGVSYVQLGNLRAYYTTGVGDLCSDCGNSFEEVGWAAGSLGPGGGAGRRGAAYGEGVVGKVCVR